MREYLFRGKRTDKGEWVYGFYDGQAIRSYYGHNYKMLTTIDEKTHAIIHSHRVMPETVGEYTGLTDNNGNRIFEGDVVTGYFNRVKIIGYIFYGAEASFFIRRDRLFGIGLNNAEDWLEVIGNIHDNPELMKEVQK